jgi:hypothetical protein
MPSMKITIEIAGWIGALLILLSYLLLSSGRLQGRSPAYQWMNLVGALGFVINSGYNGAWPSAILNVVWMVIGAVTLLRLWQQRRGATTTD